MKSKFSSIWRVAVAMALVLSLGLVMAAPASAAIESISYTNLTEPGQRIADSSAATALFQVDIEESGSVGEELDAVRITFENVSGFDQTDIDTVSVYPTDALGTVIPGTFAWVGLVATVTFTDPVVLPSAATTGYWVAIETSATIEDGDEFRATLGSTSLEIDGVWTGTGAATTYTITADTEIPEISAVAGSTLGDDTITVTFSEAVVAANNWPTVFPTDSIESPVGTALDLTSAVFVLDDTDKILTITLAYANAYLVNGDLVAVTPVADEILDMSGKAVVDDQEVSGAISGDSRAPRVALEDIVGDALGDTIDITFSEDTRGDWTVAYAGSIDKDDFASIKTGPVGSLVALDLTNAVFGYVAATFILTITLDYAIDDDYLVNDDYVAITPAATLTDSAGNPMAVTELVGTTAIGGGTGAPNISNWAFKIGTADYVPLADRPLTDADTLTITITFNEEMADSPQVSIEDDALAEEILAATDMTVGDDRTEWSYGFAVPAGHDGDATITISGTDLAGTALTSTVTDTFDIDNTAPSIPPANITSTTSAEIVIIFSEDTRGDWDAVENVSIVAADFASIKTDGTTLILDNAGFGYSANTLTITLDEAIDGAFLISGDTVAVTPASGALTDEAGNALPVTEVVGTRAVDEADLAEVWVDDDATAEWLASEANFNTIQAGINAVAIGGTVKVLPGTYAEALTIEELTLTGVKADGSNAWTVGTAGADATAPTITYEDVDGTMIRAHKDNTTIQGFNIDSSNASASRAIEFGGAPQDNFTVQYSSFNAEHSVRMIGLSAGQLATDFTITYNRFTGAADDASLSNMGNWLVIDSGTATGDTTSAVTASTNTVSYNIVTGQLDAPMHFGSGNIYDITFSNNTLSHSIYFIASVSGAGTPGSRGKIGDIVVEENTFSDQAVLVFGGASPAIANEDFEGGSFTQDDLIIHHNNFTRTFLEDVGWTSLKTISFSVTSPTEELDAENNWWSTAIASEVAAMAGSNVDYSPWLDGLHPYGEPTTTDVTVYAIDLVAGWNLISPMLIPTDSAIATVLTDVTVDSVHAYDPTATPAWTSYIPGVPSDLGTIDDGKGYWVEMSDAATLTIEGDELSTPPEMPPTYGVVVGWNLIGFKSTTAKTANAYLAAIGDQYTMIYSFSAASQLYVAVLSSDDFEPGKGYWIAITEAGTIYP